MVSRYPGAVLAAPCVAALAVDEPRPSTLADIYRDHFPFVWRLAHRLGVADGQLEDAVQDVFIVVHRRLPDFEGRSSVRTWLASIVRRVVADYRRAKTRKPALSRARTDTEVDDLQTAHATPEEGVMAREAARILYTLLDELDDDKREIFILAELEQWSLADIAVTTGLNVNTVSSRLRLARENFEHAAERLRARDAWRLK
jgi:RNA polymerase sigma-70 factor (ECF subfamily)